jgi:hypothetical protein
LGSAQENTLNYWNKKKERYFEAIRDSFYIQRIKSGPKINELLVECYIQFLPKLCDLEGNECFKDEGINLLVVRHSEMTDLNAWGK